MTITLTEVRQALSPTWRYLRRETLTHHAKLWYYFVGARLMPTVTNSEVRKERAFLTYTIMKGIKVNVGRIIYREIRNR